jgi:ribosomal protein S30
MMKGKMESQIFKHLSPPRSRPRRKGKKRVEKIYP